MGIDLRRRRPDPADHPENPPGWEIAMILAFGLIVSVVCVFLVVRYGYL